MLRSSVSAVLGALDQVGVRYVTVADFEDELPRGGRSSYPGQRCSYVKAGLALRVLKTTRASWRLRQRIASRRLFPSACLRSR
jgi:hypothetical protein